jgi:hypothetical protein
MICLMNHTTFQRAESYAYRRLYSSWIVSFNGTHATDGTNACSLWSIFIYGRCFSQWIAILRPHPSDVHA